MIFDSFGFQLQDKDRNNRAKASKGSQTSSLLCLQRRGGSVRTCYIFIELSSTEMDADAAYSRHKRPVSLSCPVLKPINPGISIIPYNNAKKPESTGTVLLSALRGERTVLNRV